MIGQVAIVNMVIFLCIRKAIIKKKAERAKFDKSKCLRSRRKEIPRMIIQMI